MHCKRCNKTITEQTVRIYGGRCVPCHRKRLSQRLPRILGETLSIIAGVLSIPFCLARTFVSLVRLWLTPLPFTRREVIEIIAPVHGRAAARTYFAGLRTGFLQGPGLSGRFFFTLGMCDGYKIQRDLSQWPGIVLRRATNPINVA